LMGIFGELDRGVTGQGPAILTVLNDNRKNYELHIYEGTNHAFHNDTGPRYDQAAACDAWAKTIAFFRKHLA
jgi:carboxymethylenebutenolidase